MSSRPSGANTAVALSRELSDFLIELSIGLHKNAIYPPGHPMLEGATTGIAHSLDGMLDQRPSLSLGVAREQLIIEGVATDEANPVLRDLAQRLHRHHLGAVRFTRGVSGEEVAGVLALLALDAGRRAKPIGLEGADVLQRWPHVRLLPLTFGQLQLLDEEAAETASDTESAEMRTDGRGAQLWIGLARASLAASAEDGAAARADSPDFEATESTDPQAVARAIDAHDKDAAYDQVVVGYLLQIAEQLKSKGDKESAALQKRLSNLVSTLQPETLARLLEMGGDRRQRQRFVSDAAQGMAADAVIELLHAAASASGQTISSSVVRMLSKLAVHAEGGPTNVRQQADTALRDQVQQLISHWALDDPNPDGYRITLEKMSNANPGDRLQRPPDRFPCEPERLVQTGIEIATLGEPVWRALDTLALRDDLAPTLDLIEGTPAGRVRDALLSHVMVPSRLRRELEREPVNLLLAQRFVTHLRLAAVDPLLDALESADDRPALAYMEMIAGLGRESGPLVVARLRGARWALQRRLLAILGKEGAAPEGFVPTEYMHHADAAVRREALRMMLRRRETHSRAVAVALADRDERIVRLAIGSVMTSCSADAAAVLAARADDQDLSPEIRALGIRALASHEAPATVRFLVSRAVGRTTLLRRRVLAAKSPEMLAAIAGLSAYWRDHPEAEAALSLAAVSPDAEISHAVARRGSSP